MFDVRMASATIDGDYTAAPVCTYWSRRAAAGVYREVTGLGDAATGGHDAAGADASGGDTGVFNNDRGTITPCTVPAAVATVGEDGVGSCGTGDDASALDGCGAAALDEQGRVDAVEAAVVTAIRITSLADGGLRDGYRVLCVYKKCTLIGLAATVGLTGDGSSGVEECGACVPNVSLPRAGATAGRHAWAAARTTVRAVTLPHRRTLTGWLGTLVLRHEANGLQQKECYKVDSFHVWCVVCDYIG